MHKSISNAARDLSVLGGLSVVPGLIASVITLLVLIFAFLSSADSRPVVPWFGMALWTGTVAAIALGWFATRMRSGSTVTIGSAALMLSLGVVLLAVWWSRAGEPAIVVVLTASTVAAVALGWLVTQVRKGSTLAIGSTALMFWLGVSLLVAWWSRDGDPAIVVVLTTLVPILAASSWWALHIARRVRSGFPGCFARPHATRRLSLPHDARVLRALGPALLGSLHACMALGGVIVLGPLLRQHAVSVSWKLFKPGVLRNFRRLREVLALRAQEVRVRDRRLPVLLLRSFADDDLAIQRTKRFLVNVTTSKLSLEEQIVAQLWEVGPVVAIGQPDLETDPIGAAREHIVGPLWQPRVQALLDESALVVVVLGQTGRLVLGIRAAIEPSRVLARHTAAGRRGRFG